LPNRNKLFIPSDVLRFPLGFHQISNVIMPLLAHYHRCWMVSVSGCRDDSSYNLHLHQRLMSIHPKISFLGILSFPLHFPFL